MKQPSSNGLLILLVMVTFFFISFVTNLVGPVLPLASDSFDLSLTLAGLLPFASFIAYAVMGIPAGYFADKYGKKIMMIFAFILAMLANFIFAFFPSYLGFIIALFIMGIGMATLQVVIYPILRQASGGKWFAFYSALIQPVYGFASYLGPLFFVYLILQFKHVETSNFIVKFIYSISSHKYSWVSIYAVSGIISVIMLIYVITIKFPKNEKIVNEDGKSGNYIKKMLCNKTVIFYFFGMMAYMSMSQGLNNWMSKYLSIYYDLSPITVGGAVVGNFWLYMMFGGALGTILTLLFNFKPVMFFYCIGLVVSFTLAIFGNAEMAIQFFPFCGFFLSILFAGIFTFTFTSIDEHHGIVSGIICSGLVGGAIFPFIIGILGDIIGLKYSLLILYFSMAYLLYMTIKAKPTVKNSTLFDH